MISKLLVEVNVLRSVPSIILNHYQCIFLGSEKNQEQLVKLALLWTCLESGTSQILHAPGYTLK